MLIQLCAGTWSALCIGFAWRAYGRCRRIAADGGALAFAGKASGSAATEQDEFERELLLRELNNELNVGQRTVKVLAQAALTGGLALGFLALTGGHTHQPEALQAFALGAVGGAVGLAMYRNAGSLADAWRARANSAANRKRRLQGVDQPKRTG